MRLSATTFDDIKYPICAAAGFNALPAVNVIRQQISIHNTDVFVTQLLNVFDTAHAPTTEGNLAPLVYLCQHALSYSRLDQFHLVPTRVMDAICGAAGLPTGVVDTASISSNDTAVKSYLRQAASLFAVELAISSATIEECAALCMASTDYLDRMMAVGLDASNVRLNLCYISRPFTAAEALQRVIAAETEVFISLITSVDGDVPGWNQWLCQNLNMNGTNKVALDGQIVLKNICTT